MNILATIGSPRKRGNTDILVDHILKRCLNKGHTGGKLYLYDYEISPFIANKRLQDKKGVVVVPSEEGPDACVLVHPSLPDRRRYVDVDHARCGKIQSMPSRRGVCHSFYDNTDE